MTRQRPISSSLVVPSLLLAAWLHAPSAAAQPEDATKRTAAQLTVYGWLAGFGGDLRPGAGAPTLRVDKSFGELFQDLDGAFFAAGLVRRDRLVFMADLSHTSSSKEGRVPTGLPPPAPPAVPAEGRLKQTSLTALGGVRVLDDGRNTLDVLGGVRAWWVRPALAVPALGVSRQADVDFVDPIVAARASFALGPRWSALVYTDVGGLGAGSRLTAQVLATINARLTRDVWLSGGYRYLMVDYEKDGVRVDSRLGGFLVGLTVAF